MTTPTGEPTSEPDPDSPSLDALHRSLDELGVEIDHVRQEVSANHPKTRTFAEGTPGEERGTGD